MVIILRDANNDQLNVFTGFFMFELTISWEKEALNKRDNSCTKTQLKQLIAEQNTPVYVWYDIFHDKIGQSLYAIQAPWQCFFSNVNACTI